MLAFFLVFGPIYGASRGDLLVALIGPAFVAFYLFPGYLIGGHWLRFFSKEER